MNIEIIFEPHQKKKNPAFYKHIGTVINSIISPIFIFDISCLYQASVIAKTALRPIVLETQMIGTVQYCIC